MSRVSNSQLRVPLLPDDENYPTESMLRNAKWGNRLITTTGMVSLGLLAALITHHSLEDKWPTPPIIVADAVSFLTAVAGKVAIMLFFNESSSLEGFKKICRKQLPDYFRLSEKNATEKLQWGVNFLLSGISSFFWSGLVKVSFKKSGDLLAEFDTKGARFMGHQLKQWYVYLPFVLSSFYANMVAWPGVHRSAYEQKKRLLNWIGGRPWKENPEKKQLNKENFYVRNTHRQVLGELKKIIEGQNHSPIIDSLLDVEEKGDQREEALVKLNRLLLLEPQGLRQLYLNKSDGEYNPPSSAQLFVKHALALLATGTSIFGFFNIVGLSHDVWKDWNAESLSKYGAAYLAYYSISEVVQLTVYPLFCNLFDVARQGMSPYVFSKRELTFIIGMVFFVGVFGGLANAEQSYLDSESIFNVINSDLASFFVDAFSIYMVLKSMFESKIRENTATDDVKILLKQGFLRLQDLGEQACALNTTSLERFSSL